MQKKTSLVRTRIAPSPTGFLHIGTARVALFNWLFTRKNKGSFVMRIEDTDEERSKPEFEKTIIEGLKWLDIYWDEGPDIDGEYGPYKQSERKELYKKEIERLLVSGSAYYCFCTKEELETYREGELKKGVVPIYSRRCRTISKDEAQKRIDKGDLAVIRLRVGENMIIEFDDVIRDHIKVNSDTIGDIVIAKNILTPLFALAGVIDDAYMKISHVIRGDDHLPNTPKQILIADALGYSRPLYAHLPLVLSEDRKKLSKRLNETSLLEYKNKGYLPEAVVNFIVLLGWHPEGDEEIFSQKELIESFTLRRVQKAGAVFDIEKLNWINSVYIKKLSFEKLKALIIDFVPKEWLDKSEIFEKALALEQERIRILSDFKETAKFFFELPPYEASLLLWKKGSAITPPSLIRENLEKIYKVLELAKEDQFIKNDIETIISNIMDSLKKGEMLWPLRVALSGQATSPSPYEILEVLGKNESLARIEEALKKINTLV
ncbi:MAG: glutamate--tRNA ligase [Candidatus Harrisonbacteria bacterium RIFCSPLOWO2_01_FULL_40_28]|uniref:Glutamate--tRNA ligase n=1 Tax=Candidatus Harrisonbacteria bacterium RIFCSPLOWO2_01_FULL_40_28 TaxID=1798406 RepID=A0A1G1ZKI1_9BACT|nr:MAG: glutamate--tRNA ligase [Candidatus Harrisonbacteria bacterium RIFCSPLOWO2_01_FULL_40_28]